MKKKTKRISRPVTLTMKPMYFRKAGAIMAKTGETISQLTRRLINEEWERRQNGERNHAPSAGPKQKLQPSDQ